MGTLLKRRRALRQRRHINRKSAVENIHSIIKKVDPELDGAHEVYLKATQKLK